MSLHFDDVVIVSPDRRPLVTIDGLTISKGLTAIAGPNGAGKSTLLRTIFGLQPLGRGRITLDNVDVIKQRRQFLRRAVFLPQNMTAYPELTGLEFLTYCLRLRGVSARDALEESRWWLDRVGLADKKGVRTATYSQGMLQRLGFAYAMQANAGLCVLDEPFAGVDPDGRGLLSDLLASEAAARVTLVCTHHVDEMVARGAQVAMVANGALTVGDAG